MKVTLGKKGLSKSWQAKFPEETECCRCKEIARVGFVAHEGIDFEEHHIPLSSLYENEGKGGFWLHDSCAVAVYFCTECLEPTALYNQG